MKLQVFTTGGTIDKVYFDANSKFEVGDPVVPFILREARVSFPFDTRELMKKDSLDLTDEDRRHIHDAVATSEATHFLITHGTDTMTDTARVLRPLSDRTIILTGSLAPARFQESDAAFNIGLAIGALQCLPPGVYIAMNGQVFTADKVRKNSERGCFEAL